MLLETSVFPACLVQPSLTHVTATQLEGVVSLLDMPGFCESLYLTQRLGFGAEQDLGCRGLGVMRGVGGG